MNFLHIISIEILFTKIWISKSNKKILIYLEISTSERYEQYKIKYLQKTFYKKFNGAEQYIEKKIEVLCSKSKLSAKEVTYLFTNNYKFC